MIRKLYTILGILLSVVLLLSACGTSSTTGNTLPPYKGPMPTVVIDNTAPANIDLDFGMSIHQPDPTKISNFTLGVAFFYQKNSIVVFKHGEKFVCNGISLPMNSSSEYTTTNIPTPGTVMNCTYTSPQGQASFSVTVPEQPKIISPISGSTITRSAQTSFLVSIIPTCKDLGIITGTKNSHGYGGASGIASPLGCIAHQIVDTSNVPAGPGMLGVNEGNMSSDATTNPGFHAFTVSIISEATIPVTWQ